MKTEPSPSSRSSPSRPSSASWSGAEGVGRDRRGLFGGAATVRRAEGRALPRTAARSASPSCPADSALSLGPSAVPGVGARSSRTRRVALQVKRGGLQPALAAATATAGRFGGFVESASSADRSGSVLLRIPEASFEQALAALKGLGTVTSSTRVREGRHRPVRRPERPADHVAIPGDRAAPPDGPGDLDLRHTARPGPAPAGAVPDRADPRRPSRPSQPDVVRHDRPRDPRGGRAGRRAGDRVRARASSAGLAAGVGGVPRRGLRRHRWARATWCRWACSWSPDGPSAGASSGPGRLRRARRRRNLARVRADERSGFEVIGIHHVQLGDAAGPGRGGGGVLLRGARAHACSQAGAARGARRVLVPRLRASRCTSASRRTSGPRARRTRRSASAG